MADEVKQTYSFTKNGPIIRLVRNDQHINDVIEFNLADNEFYDSKGKTMHDRKVRNFFAHTSYNVWLNKTIEEHEANNISYNLYKYLLHLKHYVNGSNFGSILVLYSNTILLETWWAAGIYIKLPYYDKVDTTNITTEKYKMQTYNFSKHTLFILKNLCKSTILPLEKILEIHDRAKFNEVLRSQWDKLLIIKYFVSRGMLHELSLVHNMIYNTERNCNILALDNALYKYAVNEYIEPSTAISMLDDYMEMTVAILQRNELPIKYERYPEFLYTIHDITHRNNKTSYSPSQREAFIQTINTELESKIDSEYSMTVPKRINDIIIESIELSHCVDGYVNNIINKKTYIMFLRKTETPNVPLVTVEYRDNTIVQARGSSNRSLTFEEMLALTKYGYKQKIEISRSIQYNTPTNPEHIELLKEFTMVDIATGKYIKILKERELLNEQHNNNDQQ